MRKKSVTVRFLEEKFVSTIINANYNNTLEIMYIIIIETYYKKNN